MNLCPDFVRGIFYVKKSKARITRITASSSFLSFKIARKTNARTISSSRKEPKREGKPPKSPSFFFGGGSCFFTVG